MMIGSPPQNADLPALKAAATQELARLKRNQPSIAALQAKLEALSPLASGGDAGADSLLSSTHAAALSLVKAHATMMDECEPLFVAIIDEDRPAIVRLAPRLTRTAIIAADTGPVMMRAIKLSVSGLPDVEAQIETMALMADGLAAILRFQLDDSSSAKAQERLTEVANAIRGQLPIARSELLKDARTFGNDPINPPTVKVGIQQRMWLVLQEAESYATACDELASMLSRSTIKPADTLAPAEKMRARLKTASEVFKGIDLSKYADEL